MNSTAQRTQRGFSLAEILVAVAVFTIIILGALMMYDRSNRVFKQSVEAADMQQNTRVAYEKMVADMRMIGYDFDRDGVPTGVPVVQWQPNVAYSAGAFVVPISANGFVYQATSTGTSGASSPTWNTTVTGDTTDNTITWKTESQIAFQQPDEQIEYAGPNAVVFRGNFNYSDPTTTDNGTEPSYETAQFPVVTTSNQEIVAYALRSMKASANTGSISFYADVAKPRAAYPGGSAETLVTISGIDTSQNEANAPYQLVRFTLQDDGTANGGANVGKPDAGTVVAENIRSLQFYYYQTADGQTVLNNAGVNIATGHNADGSTFTAQDTAGNYTGAIGGDGKYDPANIGGTTDFADRQLRTSIKSIRVALVGMNASQDAAYTNATETSTVGNLKNYRTYSLSTLVVPRNLGLSGSGEASPVTPGNFSLLGICVGSCTLPTLYWSQPTTGTVGWYEVHWDKVLNGLYSKMQNAGLNTSLMVTSPPLTANQPYYFYVAACNESGCTKSQNYIQVTPYSTTKPGAPTGVTTTGAANVINLQWTPPTLNDTSANTLSCTPSGSGSTDGTAITAPINYNVWRSTSKTFNPATPGPGDIQVVKPTNASQIVFAGSNATWADNATNNPVNGPAPCVDYYYRVQTYYPGCTIANSDYNLATATYDPTLAYSIYAPAVGNDAQGPVQMTSSDTPGAASNLQVNTAASSCNPAAPPNGLCNVVLTWNKVTQNSAAQPMSIDAYQINRWRYNTSNPLAPTLPSTFIVTGQSSTSGSLGTWTDTTMEDHDATGLKWIYRYSVQALNQCNNALGTASATVDYPSNCPVPVVYAAGADPGGDGTSPGDPWVMNGGDTIDVNAPPGSTIAQVNYVVTDSGGNGIDNVTTAAGPNFTYAWKDQGSYGALFNVAINVTFSTGCITQTTRYVEQKQLASCLTVDSPNAVYTCPSPCKSYTTVSMTVTYTITNPNVDPLTITSISPNSGVHMFWAQPAWATNPMTLTTVVYNGTKTVTGSFAPGTYDETAANVAALPKIPGSGTYTIAFTFSWTQGGIVPPFPIPSPLSDLCLTFTDSVQTFSCNIVGPTTNNPQSCN